MGLRIILKFFLNKINHTNHTLTLLSDTHPGDLVPLIRFHGKPKDFIATVVTFHCQREIFVDQCRYATAIILVKLTHLQNNILFSVTA